MTSQVGGPYESLEEILYDCKVLLGSRLMISSLINAMINALKQMAPGKAAGSDKISPYSLNTCQSISSKYSTAAGYKIASPSHGEQLSSSDGELLSSSDGGQLSSSDGGQLLTHCINVYIFEDSQNNDC